jgi:hypothetical protein
MALSKHDSHNGPRSSFLYYILTPPFINHEKFACLWLRSVWRYQRGNHNPYIEEEQTTQWPKEKVQKDKQRSTKHTYKTKDRVTRTHKKNGCKHRCSRSVSSSCSTRDIRRVNLVTSPLSLSLHALFMEKTNRKCRLSIRLPFLFYDHGDTFEYHLCSSK